MLSALPQILTPSAVAAADSLGNAPRSSTEGGSGFAALMQRQAELRSSDLRLSDLRLSDLRMADQRLAEQRQSQARNAEPAPAPANARSPVGTGGSNAGSNAGAERSRGDTDSSGARSSAPDDRAGNEAGSGAGSGTVRSSANSTASSSGAMPPDQGTESRNAASLSLNSKLQRARNEAQDATRQAAAGAPVRRAGIRLAAGAAAGEDGASPPPALNRPDDPLPDSTAAPAVTLPLPSAVAPVTADLAQRGDSLSAPDRTSAPGMPVGSGAAELAGPAGSRRSTTGWVVDQQRLRDAGAGWPTAPDDAGSGKRVAVVPGQDAGSTAARAADLLAPALAGDTTGPSGGPSALAHTAAAANAGGHRRSAALPGAPDGSAPQDPANTRRIGAGSDLAPDLADPAEVASVGRGLRRAGPASPASRPNSPPTASTTDAAETPDAGMPTHAAAALAVNSASLSTNANANANASTHPSANPIDTDPSSGTRSASGIDSPALTGTVTAAPGAVLADAVVGVPSNNAARRWGESAAVSAGAKAGNLAPAGAGAPASLRSGATAAADGLPGQSGPQVDNRAGPDDPDSAARPTRKNPVPARPGAESAALTSPSPASDPALAGYPANAPTGSSAAAGLAAGAASSASSSPSAGAPQSDGPVAGADPRRAAAASAGPDGAAVSHRAAGGERAAALARDGAGTEATEPAALPTERRAVEPAKAAGPVASADPAALPSSHAATPGAGLDNGQGRQPGESAAVGGVGPAGPVATTPAATPAAALHRSDATGPNAAPVEARVAVPLDSPAFAPAFGAQISLFARDGVQTARLQLNPVEMGPIAVQIAVDGNAARIDFQADRAATREVIEASLPALAGALQDAGLTLTGGGVFQQHPGRQAPPEPGPAQAPARLPAAGSGLDTVAGGLAAASRQRTPRGLVDLVA